MKALLYILSGLFVTVQAQVMLPHRQAVSAPSGPFTPYSIPILRYYWSAEDLAAGPVTTWTDRIQGARYINKGTSPTNNADGIFFGPGNGAGEVMTNTPQFSFWGTSSATFWIVCALWNPSGAFTFGGLINAPSGSSTVTIQTTNRFSYSGSDVFYVPFNNTAFLDIAMVISNNTEVWCYTNGVLATNKAAGQLGGGLTQLGLTGANSYGKFKVREMVWWSNIVSVANIQNLHNYATNKYGYTP